MSYTTSQPDHQSSSSSTPTDTSTPLDIALIRKRVRCDSDLTALDRERPPEKKMSKANTLEVDDADADADAEMMDGFGVSICSHPESSHSAGGSSSSSSGSGSLCSSCSNASSSTLSSLPMALRQAGVDGAHTSHKGKSSVYPNPRPKPNYKRDETYYHEDGSCVLLISDTLFNVHRSMLSKDNSSFGTMFSLPQGNNAIEGRSDDNPIVLTGDTPDEFRHFLWALYALPHELDIVSSPSANLTHLIDIARVAHKYAFKGLETWALDAIQNYVNRKPSPILNGMQPYAPSSPSSSSSNTTTTTTSTATVFSNAHSSSSSTTADTSSSSSTSTDPEPQDTPTLLTRLIRLAQLCQHDRLLSTMIALLRQLMASSVTYAYLAMSLADELDLRALRGAAYFEVMQKAVVVRGVGVDVLRPAPTPTPAVAVAAAAGGGSTTGSVVQDDTQPSSLPNTPTPTPTPLISRAQQLRLLSGYYRLTSTWDALRLTPLPFEHSHSCSATWHQQGCTQSWLEFWKEKTRSDAVMGLGMADVLGRLRMVQKDYERWGSATYMHHDCRMVAKRAIGDVVRRVEEALPDYFADPGGWEG